MTNTTEVVEIDYCPFEYQEGLHDDDTRFRVIAGGRRVGKSQVALQEILVHCLTTPKALAWWVARTYRDAQEVGWEMFMEHYEVLRPAIKFIHRSNLTVTFINGAKLIFKGSDNADSLRGRGLTYCVLDEAAFIAEDVWTKVLRPALSDKKGKALFTSTPNGRNWFYNLFKRAAYPSTQSWQEYHWPTYLNPIIGEEELADARDNLCDTDYRQEYAAEFVTKAGMIYDDFTDDNTTDDFIPNKYTHTFYIGMDFGFANPSAITFMAIDNKTMHVTQFDELYLTRTPMEQIELKMRQTLGKYGLSLGDVTHVYTDPAGNADEISSGISPVDYLREAGWRVVNKGTLVAPGLALVRSFVLNASGKRRFTVHTRCRETVRSMFGYTYLLGVRGVPLEDPDKDGVHDHACDAVRYFFVNRFDNARYVFSELEQEKYGGVDKRAKQRTMKRCGECRQMFLSYTPKTRPPYLCKECLEDAN